MLCRPERGAERTGALPTGQFVLFGDAPGVHRGNGFGAEIWLVVDLHLHPGAESWEPDLTTTNFPGMGSAVNHRIAIFRALE